MKPGARFLIAAPDRDYTFDSRRETTTSEHLWREFEDDVRVPDDEHLADALVATGVELPEDPETREALFAMHRDRSYHVHVWDEAAFAEFLHMVIERGGLDLDVVAHAGPREADGNLIYVLERR